MTDGAYIRLPDQAAIEDPIHLLFISTGENEALASYPRIFIAAGADTRLQLVESCCSVGETYHLTNTLTEIVAEERGRGPYTRGCPSFGLRFLCLFRP